MLLSQPPRRANAVAALAATGHLSPAGRRPVAGAVQHAQRPATATRPGPRPLSAQQAAAVSQRNAATRRLVRQATSAARTQLMQSQVRVPTANWATYKPGAAGRQPWQEVRDADGQPYYATQVQHVWVYGRQIDGWGTMEFFVVNPRTGTCVAFTPVGYISAKEQIQATASATGAFGDAYGRFLAVTAATLFTGGAALEYEAGTAALAATRGFLIRAWQFGATQAVELGSQVVKEFTWSKFATKAVLDGTVQFGSGWLTKGSAAESMGDLNFVSMLVAGIMPGEGFRPALRNSVFTSTVKVGAKVSGKETGLYIELPELTSMAGVEKYLLNIASGTLGDLAKLHLTESASPFFRWASRAMGRTNYVDLNWLSAHRELLGTLLPVPLSMFVDSQKDQAKDRLQKRLDKVMAPHPATKAVSGPPTH